MTCIRMKKLTIRVRRLDLSDRHGLFRSLIQFHPQYFFDDWKVKKVQNKNTIILLSRITDTSLCHVPNRQLIIIKLEKGVYLMFDFVRFSFVFQRCVEPANTHRPGGKICRSRRSNSLTIPMSDQTSSEIFRCLSTVLVISVALESISIT